MGWGGRSGGPTSQSWWEVGDCWRAWSLLPTATAATSSACLLASWGTALSSTFARYLSTSLASYPSLLVPPRSHSSSGARHVRHCCPSHTHPFVACVKPPSSFLCLFLHFCFHSPGLRLDVLLSASQVLATILGFTLIPVRSVCLFHSPCVQLEDRQKYLSPTPERDKLPTNPVQIRRFGEWAKGLMCALGTLPRCSVHAYWEVPSHVLGNLKGARGQGGRSLQLWAAEMV